MRNTEIAVVLRRTACLALMALMMPVTAALANEPAPAPKPAPKKPEVPSALTGNVLPHCDAGKYAGGGVCKPSPPDYYTPSGSRYPIACPKGSHSPAGSRGLGECMFPDGRSAAAPVQEKPKESSHH